MKKIKKEISFSIIQEDGRTATFLGELVRKTKKSLVLIPFKKTVWSLQKKSFDSVDFLLKKTIVPLDKVFNFAQKEKTFDPRIHAWDDGG